MKRKLSIIFSLIVLASAGFATQASAKEHMHTHTHTQQCVGPAGFCTPYFGS
jgi:hypothetical protein